VSRSHRNAPVFALLFDPVQDLSRQEDGDALEAFNVEQISIAGDDDIDAGRDA
jgi:hypothetical protein